jgi:hypothetical protein
VLRGDGLREGAVDALWRLARIALAPIGWWMPCRLCFRGRCAVLFGLHRDGRRGLFLKCRVCGGMRRFR